MIRVREDPVPGRANSRLRRRLGIRLSRRVVGRRTQGVFRVPKTPECIDLSEKIQRARRSRKKPRKGKADVIEGEELARQLAKFVWKNGIPGIRRP